MMQSTRIASNIGSCLLARRSLTMPRCSSLLLTLTTASFSSSSRWQEEEKVSSNNERPKKALVLGSSGALGSHVSRYLSKELRMQVLGADVMELPHELTEDWELDGFVALERGADLATLTTALVRAVDAFVKQETDDVGDDDGLDAIVCASGGWQSDPPDVKPASSGGNKGLTRDEIVAGAQNYAETINNMMRMNLDPVLAAGYVAQHYMNVSSGGLMVVIGATVALSPAPGMLGYGLSKSAAHYLVRTLGACTENTLESKSIRKAGRAVRRNLPALDRLRVTAILPTTLDTPANRRAMPNSNGDTSQWTKPQDISIKIGEWIQTPALRPHSGSLFKVHPTTTSGEDGGEGGGASFELVL